MKKYFYEKSKFSEFKSNKTYHELLSMNQEEFTDWAKLMRKEIIHQWDIDGQPPVMGKNEEQIKTGLSKLREFPCEFFSDDDSDEESLGVIKNFNKHQTVVNHFFPTMLKTRITNGSTADDKDLSIYEHFSQDDKLENFVKVMNRAVKRDSMYAWCRSLTNKPEENEFWNGQNPVQFIKDAHAGKVFTGKWEEYDILLHKTKHDNLKRYGTPDEDERTYGNIFYLESQEIKELLQDGYLNNTQISNLGDIPDTEVLKSGKVNKFVYNVRWYDKTEGVFPKIVQSFRLGFGAQPAVNFPALTAKWLYEKYTDHIKQDEPFTIYDSSSGWGGRIIGAMSAKKKIHYVGTDPNPDNFIDELDTSRYEYVADFYNKTCIDKEPEGFGNFFESVSEANTYELFRDGSEVIHENPRFQKYDGKLDLSFTSPPYFNREQYSQDNNQSFRKFGEYNDWKENFLRPTLTTIYNYTKDDRYILWNIASIKIDKNNYFDLEEDSVKILKELGADYKGKLKMLMTQMVGISLNKRSGMSSSVKNIVNVDGKDFKYEPIFVFHKK